MNVKELLCKTVREKPETKRASRKISDIDMDKVIHMGLNENVFGMSPYAAKVMQETSPTSNYYADWGQKEIKQAIAKHFGVTKDYVVIGCGSSALIDALGTAFLEVGDELALCMPTFPAIIDTAQMNGARPVTVPLTDELVYDMDALYGLINERTKMVYICNPNNPTGTYVGIDALMDFARKCPDSVIQVYDEAYIEFAQAQDCVEMVEAMKELDKPIIVLKTFSKFYGMAGVRVGYALAKPEINQYLSLCGTQFCVSKIAQAGAAAAIQDVEHGRYVKSEVTKWRDYLTEEMEKLGCKVYHSQTNFMFFDPHVNPEQVAAKMMERGIMISAQAGLNRVSIGKPEHNELYIKYLGEIIEELRA